MSNKLEAFTLAMILIIGCIVLSLSQSAHDAAIEKAWIVTTLQVNQVVGDTDDAMAYTPRGMYKIVNPGQRGKIVCGRKYKLRLNPLDHKIGFVYGEVQ